MKTLELTSYETEVLQGIARLYFSYFDEGVKLGSHTWSEEFSHEVAYMNNISWNAAGGVVSSLIKKNIFVSIESTDGTELQLTAVGVDAIERVKA